MTHRLPQAGFSHVIGLTDQPLIEKTIPEMLLQTAARFGDREAVSVIK